MSRAAAPAPPFMCPACGQPLEQKAGKGRAPASWTCTCGATFPTTQGFPDLVHPRALFPSDAEFREKYDKGADRYEVGLEWLFKSFSEDEAAVRESLVDLLELRPGHTVLEVGCGTGRDSEHILEQIGARGRLCASELSSGMLELARKQLRGPVELLLCNASYLPYASGAFDAAYHFGGLNTFAEKRRAIEEMTRVVRPGGRVVIGDEAVAPWLRRKTYGRILAKANPLYKHTPPLELLPERAQDVSVRWLLGNAFYVISYRVGTEGPRVDLDLPIPGKGDSLRSRYYGAAKR